MRRHLLASIVMLLGVMLVLGFGYPLLVTGLSALLFSRQADGSLVYRGGKLAGSSLLGQSFAASKGSRFPGTSSRARRPRGPGMTPQRRAPPISAPQTRCSSGSSRV
jgi:K+-transporting ATPase ATPase C chain